MSREEISSRGGFGGRAAASSSSSAASLSAGAPSSSSLSLFSRDSSGVDELAVSDSYGSDRTALQSSRGFGGDDGEGAWGAAVAAAVAVDAACRPAKRKKKLTAADRGGLAIDF